MPMMSVGSARTSHQPSCWAGILECLARSRRPGFASEAHLIPHRHHRCVMAALSEISGETVAFRHSVTGDLSAAVREPLEIQDAGSSPEGIDDPP